MPFDKKTLDKWETAKDEKQKTVLAFLEKSGFTLTNIKGSHFTFKHPALGEVVASYPSYARVELRSGVLVVVCHDNKVYAPYLRRIVQACQLIDEYEAVKERKK